MTRKEKIRTIKPEYRWMWAWRKLDGGYMLWPSGGVTYTRKRLLEVSDPPVPESIPVRVLLAPQGGARKESEK